MLVLVFGAFAFVRCLVAGPLCVGGVDGSRVLVCVVGVVCGL